MTQESHETISPPTLGLETESPKVQDVQSGIDNGGDKVNASVGRSKEGSRKRRSQNGEPGESSNTVQRTKRKGGTVVAGVLPICSVCKRNFASFKGLFGHSRTHSKLQRPWKGAYPAPIYNPDWIQRSGGDGDEQQPIEQQPTINQQVVEQEVIPALLELAEETTAKIQQEEIMSVVSKEHGNNSSRVLDLDLNSEPPSSYSLFFHTCSH